MIAVQAVSEHGGKTHMETTHLRLTRDRRHLAQELARSVVGSVAGHETPDFDQRAAAHFRPRLRWTRPNQFDPQGMAGELATPVALAVATALLGTLHHGGGQTGAGHRRDTPTRAAPGSPPPGRRAREGHADGGACRLSATDLAQWRAIAVRRPGVRCSRGSCPADRRRYAREARSAPGRWRRRARSRSPDAPRNLTRPTRHRNGTTIPRATGVRLTAADHCCVSARAAVLADPDRRSRCHRLPGQTRRARAGRMDLHQVRQRGRRRPPQSAAPDPG